MSPIMENAFASAATIAEVRQEAFVDRGLFPDDQDENRWTWNQNQLRDWRAHPEHLVDEEIEPPRPWLIDKLLSEFAHWRASGVPAPSYVSPSGEGGIVLGWRREPQLIEFEIAADRSVECRRFVDSRLVETRSFPTPQ